MCSLRRPNTVPKNFNAVAFGLRAYRMDVWIELWRIYFTKE